MPVSKENCAKICQDNAECGGFYMLYSDARDRCSSCVFVKSVAASDCPPGNHGNYGTWNMSECAVKEKAMPDHDWSSSVAATLTPYRHIVSSRCCT